MRKVFTLMLMIGVLLSGCGGPPTADRDTIFKLAAEQGGIQGFTVVDVKNLDNQILLLQMAGPKDDKVFARVGSVLRILSQSALPEVAIEYLVDQKAYLAVKVKTSTLKDYLNQKITKDELMKEMLIGFDSATQESTTQKK